MTKLRTIVGATLLLAGCNAPPQAQSPAQAEDYGKRLRRECESVWREVKDNAYVGERVKNVLKPDDFVALCIIKRAMPGKPEIN
jgi:hypothetical protein